MYEHFAAGETHSSSRLAFPVSRAVLTETAAAFRLRGGCGACEAKSAAAPQIGCITPSAKQLASSRRVAHRRSTEIPPHHLQIPLQDCGSVWHTKRGGTPCGVDTRTVPPLFVRGQSQSSDRIKVSLDGSDRMRSLSFLRTSDAWHSGARSEAMSPWHLVWNASRLVGPELASSLEENAWGNKVSEQLLKTTRT